MPLPGHKPVSSQYQSLLCSGSTLQTSADVRSCSRDISPCLAGTNGGRVRGGVISQCQHPGDVQGPLVERGLMCHLKNRERKAFVYVLCIEDNLTTHVQSVT